MEKSARPTHDAIKILSEEEWERVGLAMLGQDDGEAVVLFSSDGELKEFRRSLAAYAGPIPEGQSNPAYASLIGAIEEFRPLGPKDRIGPQLRNEGFWGMENFADATRRHAVDVELWDTGSQALRIADTGQADGIGCRDH